MPSRMERYYEAKEGQPSRIRKNQTLYNQIYDGNEEYTAKEYSNVEGVAKAPSKDTINIDKIREMINKREEKNKNKHIHEEIKIEQEPEEQIEEEPKNYDINDILNKAKDERPNKDTEEDYHSLKNVELNILKNLQLNKNNDNESVDNLENTNSALDIKDNPEEISKLFNTITNTSMLNKLGDKELSLDLLGDLKSNGTTIIESSETIKNILNESNKKETQNDDEEPMDKSFYTSTLKLKKIRKAFLNDKDIDENEKSNTPFKIFIIISSIIAVIIIAIIIYKLILK